LRAISDGNKLKDKIMEGNLLFAFIGTGVMILVLVLLHGIYKRMLIPVETVAAGADHAPSTTARPISPFESFYHNGKKVNPKKYIVRTVSGDCMTARNIYAGDLLFIEPFDGDVSHLNKRDILLIKKGDSDYKIREYVDVDARDAQKLRTLYYPDGKPKDSSKPHDLSRVEGIVRFKFAVGG
jgi:hypothetical protein